MDVSENHSGLLELKSVFYFFKVSKFNYTTIYSFYYLLAVDAIAIIIERLMNVM